MSDTRIANKNWRMSNLYKILNKSSQRVNFELNPAQKHFDDNKTKRNIILKSRRLGFTTYKAISMLDNVLFNPNYEGLLIAHKTDDSEKIFQKKLLYAWRNLNPELKGLWQVLNDSASRLTFDFGNGAVSSLSVSTSGRSSTLNEVHISEFGKIAISFPQKAIEIISGTIPAVVPDGVIDIESTAEGEGGMFYDLFWDNYNKPLREKTSKSFTSFFYNWRWDTEEILMTDSIKTLPEEFLEIKKIYNLSHQEVSFYFNCFKSLNEDWSLLRREYPTTPEEAFAYSLEGSFYNKELQKYKNNIGEQYIYDPLLYVNTAWDIGMDDYTVIWFFQLVGNDVRVIDYYEIGDEGLPHCIEILKAKGYKYGKHYAPHDIKVREWTRGNYSRYEVARGLGVKFEIEGHDFSRLSLADGIQAVRRILPRVYFDINKTSEGIKHLRNYTKKQDKKTGLFISEPDHNEHSHGADAFRVLAEAVSSLSSRITIKTGIKKEILTEAILYELNN